MELCPNGKNAWVQQPRCECGVALHTITPCNPLREFVLPIPNTLDSVGLGVWLPKGESFHWGTQQESKRFKGDEL